MLKRLVLFAVAFLAAALIVGATLRLRQQAEGADNSAISQLSRDLTPSPLPTGFLSQPQTIPFPGTETAVIEHPFFPLTAAHAGIPCTSCHIGDVFEDLGSECIDCHVEDDVHNGTNGPNCALCHMPTLWQDATFDHSTIGQRDCGECHAPPPNHFPGACSNCHIDTTTFLNISFDHSTIGSMDCAACHAPPPNHFPGACSTCHIDTTTFLNISFDHSTIGSMDCAACHAPPPNHFPGACSSCHIDTSNFRNVNFDHSVIGSTDCVACHAPPPNHFPGACSSCHIDTNNFRNVNFNHSVIGSTDCVACHAPPPNHFPGACSSCHMDTTNFRNVNFSHTFPLNHGGANGQCSTCHTNNDTAVYTCTACHNQEEMVEEHEDKDIFDIANCVACHADGEKPDD